MDAAPRSASSHVSRSVDDLELRYAMAGMLESAATAVQGRRPAMSQDDMGARVHKVAGSLLEE